MRRNSNCRTAVVAALTVMVVLAVIGVVGCFVKNRLDDDFIEFDDDFDDEFDDDFESE